MNLEIPQQVWDYGLVGVILFLVVIGMGIGGWKIINRIGQFLAPHVSNFINSQVSLVDSLKETNKRQEAHIAALSETCQKQAICSEQQTQLMANFAAKIDQHGERVTKILEESSCKYVTEHKR